MRPRNNRYLPLSARAGGTSGLLENQGPRPALAEGGSPPSDGVGIPSQSIRRG